MDVTTRPRPARDFVVCNVEAAVRHHMRCVAEIVAEVPGFRLHIRPYPGRDLAGAIDGDSHDLRILPDRASEPSIWRRPVERVVGVEDRFVVGREDVIRKTIDRKSTRLNSSHGYIS